MSGVSIRVDARGLGGVEAALARLAPLDGVALLNGLARRIQEQTRRRIEDLKTAPDGTLWPANRAGTPTLYRSGALSRSIDYAVQGDRLIVGSGLIYAAIHQYGGTILPKRAGALVFKIGDRTVRAKRVRIPPRPYLGLSAGDGIELVEIVAAYIRRRLA